MTLRVSVWEIIELVFRDAIFSIAFSLAHLLYSSTSDALDLPDRECAICDLPIKNTNLINPNLYIHFKGAAFRGFRRYRLESATRGRS